MMFYNLQSTFTYDISFHPIAQTSMGILEADKLILIDEETEARKVCSL